MDENTIISIIWANNKGYVCPITPLLWCYFYSLSSLCFRSLLSQALLNQMKTNVRYEDIFFCINVILIKTWIHHKEPRILTTNMCGILIRYKQNAIIFISGLSTRFQLSCDITSVLISRCAGHVCKYFWGSLGQGPFGVRGWCARASL